MELKEAEENLEWAKNDLATDRSVVDTLAWAIAELKKAQDEIKEDAGIRAIARRKIHRAETDRDSFEEILKTERRLKKRMTWLPEEELQEVLHLNERSELQKRVIGGIADHKKKQLILVRGDWYVFISEFASYKKSGDGTEPDFKKLYFTDYGHSIGLGNYEAAADVVISETKDVHTEHCCVRHQCKYGEYDDCTVVLGIAKQSFPCEACDDDEKEKG